jgi:hypothetical protein
MKRQIFAGALALALATGMTTSAMAFGHGGGHGFAGHVGGMHAGIGAFHGGSFAANRMTGVRGYSAMRHGGWGGRRFVGGYGGYGYGGWDYPYDNAYAADVGIVGLGLGLAGLASGYCGPYDYSYSYSYGYCGPSVVVGW